MWCAPGGVLAGGGSRLIGLFVVWIWWICQATHQLGLIGHVTLLSEGVVALIVGGKVAALITQSAGLFFGRQRCIAVSALI
ncbi:hypothetical protein BOP93_15295 [Pseudomonas orientalis]|uniref:Uncharacterized protein n=1 Tax=Pseudomonas orientalis TaxID=76758 RepID=A0A2L0RXS8_9PSED|nr:hypothetical protein BOP93_15295 [Pseudomonas orientalis]